MMSSNLQFHHFFVAGAFCFRRTHQTDEADVRLYADHQTYEGGDLGFVEIMIIVNPQIIFAMAFFEVHHYRFETIEFDSFILCGTKHQWLSLLEEQCFFRLGSFFCKDFKCTIVKDVTVLVDFKGTKILYGYWPWWAFPAGVWDHGPCCVQ